MAKNFGHVNPPLTLGPENTYGFMQTIIVAGVRDQAGSEIGRRGGYGSKIFFSPHLFFGKVPFYPVLIRFLPKCHSIQCLSDFRQSAILSSAYPIFRQSAILSSAYPIFRQSAILSSAYPIFRPGQGGHKA